MLSGIVRKLSLTVLVLSLVGYVVFVVGFGFRNVSYNDQSNNSADAPEYFFYWFCMMVGPVLYVLSFILSTWESKIPAFLVFLFVPAYLVSLGAILFLNGLLIYTFFQVDDSAPQRLDVNIQCFDVRSNTTIELTDINREQKYIAIEFAGALASVAFYWVYLTMIPFFSEEY